MIVMSARAAFGSVPRFPFIYNVTMTVANTEYSQELPENCKAYLVHTRDETVFRLAFETGYVATPTEPYLTVLANSRYFEPLIGNITYGGARITLYFASTNAGKVIEIVAWV